MMIRPFLYDIKRTLTSKTVLILVAITLLLSLTIIPFTTMTTRGASRINATVLYFKDGAHHFLGYAYNQYGDPVGGAKLNVTLATNFNLSQSVSQIEVTNSSGLAFLSLAATVNYTVIETEITYSSGQGMVQQNFSGYLPQIPAGKVKPIAGYVFSTVVDKADSSKMDVQVFYAAQNGTVPYGYQVYFKLASFSGPGPQPNPFNRNQMTFLGNLTSYRRIFDPDLSGGNKTSQVWFAIFAPGNDTAAESIIYNSLRIPPTPINEADVASSFFSGILSFFIPLMAIIGSYSSYGRDRLTGVLESVLARPITRFGLAVSRFLSDLLAMGIAVIATVFAVDAVLNYRAGSFLSQGYVLAVAGGLLVELAAFIGIVFLLSQLVKSTAALLGISIALFVVLDFFWSLIIFLLTVALGGTSDSFLAMQATYYSFYANPAQFITLVNAYFFQSTGAIQSSSYGVTLPAIIIAGVLWSVVPFTIFMYLAVKRD